MRGIYELDGDRLKICIGYPRPKEFDGTKERQSVIYLRRQTVIDVVFEVIYACLPPSLRW